MSSPFEDVIYEMLYDPIIVPLKDWLVRRWENSRKVAYQTNPETGKERHDRYIVQYWSRFYGDWISLSVQYSTLEEAIEVADKGKAVTGEDYRVLDKWEKK